MAKLTDQTLDELYAKPKKTSAVRAAIILKTDFSKIDTRYCEEVCTLKCKSPGRLNFHTSNVDVLIIQDHRSPPGKYDRREGQQDRIQNGVIEFIAKQAGFSGLTYRVTHLLRCAATEEDFPSGKPPTQTTMQKCFPYLKAEILSSKPKVIISLGTATTKALGLSKHSNTGDRGEIAFSEYGPVVITLHPRILTYIRQNARGAAGMWGPDYLNVIKRDFEKARKLVTGELSYTPTTMRESLDRLAKENIRIAKTLEEAAGYMQEIEALPESSVISFDTETNSLDPLQSGAKLLCIQFGWRDPATSTLQARVIPLWHRSNTFFDPGEAWKLVEPFLVGPRPKAGHNGKFDILFIWWTCGVRVQNYVFDTLLLLHSIESGTQGCYSLKTACHDHLLELGFAGYEDDLGDLKALKKQLEKAQGEVHNEGENLDEIVESLDLQRNTEV
jgi:uracil-DNA glycosylase family 4